MLDIDMLKKVFSICSQPTVEKKNTINLVVGILEKQLDNSPFSIRVFSDGLSQVKYCDP
jgi:hypothetical protein